MTTLQLTTSRRYGTLSPLRYPGGKAALAGLFADLISELEISDCTYVEPYAGGAGAGIALLQEGVVHRLVINDIDPSVHAFWREVVDSNEDFVRWVQDVPLTMDEWHRHREVYRATRPDPKDLGRAFFYLNRTNRSGVLRAGVIGGLDQSGNYKMDARFNRATLMRRLEAIGERADDITVTALDGRTVIEKFSADPRAFLYIDPPYVKAGGRLYLNAFEGRDHQALATVVNEISAAHWLMSYDMSPLIYRLYEGHFQATLQLNYSARYPGKANELIVTSDSVRAALRSIPQGL